VDLRKKREQVVTTTTNTQSKATVVSTTAITNSEQPQNRFVKNILKKTQGQGAQVRTNPAKHVSFIIGTGTRAQAHNEEISNNYNAVNDELDTSNATETSSTLYSK